MKKSILFFCLAVVCWVLAILLLVRFVKVIAEAANSNLAVIEAPGSVIFPIEEAGTVSLWHNYQDFRNGKTVSHPPEVPGGFGFELKELSTGALVPFAPGMGSTTVTGGQTSKSGLGTFEVATAGDYELTVTTPPGESRIISLSEGTFMEVFGKIFGLAGTATLFGLVGFVFLIIAIVFLVKSKSKALPPPHAT